MYIKMLGKFSWEHNYEDGIYLLTALKSIFVFVVLHSKCTDVYRLVSLGYINGVTKNNCPGDC